MGTESPCPDHGGTSAKRKCKQCKKEYDRRYRQENRDKIAEQKRRYRQENRERIAKKDRRYYQKNRDKIAERSRRYNRENHEKITEQKRRYYQENRDEILEQHRHYYQENREKIAERKRRYYQENRDYFNTQMANHEAAKNRVSQYLATNSGKLWTPQEVAKMQRLRRQGLTNYEIAAELGRTYSAVRARIAEENARN